MNMFILTMDILPVIQDAVYLLTDASMTLPHTYTTKRTPFFLRHTTLHLLLVPRLDGRLLRTTF